MNEPDLQPMSNEEITELIILAKKFKSQQVGRRPGEFNRYIASLVVKMSKPTFANLLYQLELAAVIREEEGEKASPIEKVNRVFEEIIFHDKRKGRIHKPFGTVRNCLTKAKKELLTLSPKS